MVSIPMLIALCQTSVICYDGAVNSGRTEEEDVLREGFSVCREKSASVSECAA